MEDINSEIKAPLLGLKEWRETMIPESVRENPYLKAFEERRRQLNWIAITGIAILWFVIGNLIGSGVIR